MSPGRRLTIASGLIGLALLAVACGGNEDEAYSGEPSGTIAFTAIRDGKGEIFIMSGDGSGQTNLTRNDSNDTEPSWSSDGSLIAFSSTAGGALDIWVMKADGGDLHQLMDTPAVDGGAEWSPDGTKIAYYSFLAQSQGLLWAMNADGSDAKPLLADLVPDPQTACAGGFPGAWFPDGKILFRGAQASERALQLCTVSPDGSNIEVLFSQKDARATFPDLSPDGKKIVFTFKRGDGNPEIYVMKADGTNLRQITDDPAIDGNAAWSPDGEWIAFHSNRDGNFNIYIVRPDGSDLRRLTDHESDDLDPAWTSQQSDLATATPGP